MTLLGPLREPHDVEEIARGQGVPATIVERARAVQGNQQALRDLAVSIGKKDDELPVRQKQAVNGLLLESTRRSVASELKETIKKNPHNFIEDVASIPGVSTLEDHQVFKNTIQSFENFCAIKDPLWPPDYYKEWVGLISAKIVEKTSVDGIAPVIDYKQVQDLFDAMKKPAKDGPIGEFEDWFEHTHRPEYDKWIADKTNANTIKTEQDDAITKAIGDSVAALPNLSKFPKLAQRFEHYKQLPPDVTVKTIEDLKTVGEQLDEEHTRAADLLNRFNKLPAYVIRAVSLTARNEITNLATSITASDGNDIDSLVEKNTEWDELIGSVEKLITEAVPADKFPEATLAPILTSVIKKETNYDQAHASIELIKGPTAAPATGPTIGQATTATGEELLPGEERSSIDAWIESLNDLPDEEADASPLDKFFSSLKKGLKPIASFVASITTYFATSSIAKYIEKYAGISFRDTLVDSETLLKSGDKRAAVCVLGKRRLRAELKIEGAVMNKIKGMTAAKFIETYEKKPSEFPGDATQKSKLDLLAKKVKPKLTKQTGALLLTEILGSKISSGGYLIENIVHSQSSPAEEEAPAPPSVAAAPTANQPAAPQAAPPPPAPAKPTTNP